jgi:hypothetical protein
MNDRRTSANFALTICGLLGAAAAGVIVVGTGHVNLSAGGLLLGGLLWLGLAFMLAMLLFTPYAVMVLGVLKIREQRASGAEALGDENAVKSDPDGERKLHDYLTAIGSMEARIGLLQRSAPYVPPEQRPPEGTPVLRWRLRKPAKAVRLSNAVSGAIFGLWLVAREIDGGFVLRTPAEGIAAMTIGAIGGYIVGTIFSWMLWREVEEIPKEPNDAGAGGSETA